MSRAGSYYFYNGENQSKEKQTDVKFAGSMKPKYFIFVTFVLFVFLSITYICPAAWAATYYVDKNHSKASDVNSGTEDAPFKTIQRGASKAVAGDTVYVKAGTYYGSVFIYNSGKPGAPITFKNYMNDVVTIDGEKKTNKLVDWEAKDYIVWDGIDVRNSGKSGLWAKGNYCTIMNSEIYDNGTMGSTGATGLTVIKSDHTTVKNNVVHNNGWNGISISVSNNTTVEHNIAYDNYRHFGIQLMVPPSETAAMYHNNNVRYNIIYGNNNGFFSRYQEYNEVSNNLIFNNNGHGMMYSYLAEKSGSFSTYEGHTKIYNNTITGNGRYGILNESATHLLIKNNIISYNLSEAILDRKNSNNHILENNLYYKNKSSGIDSKGITGDPLFKDMANNDYSVKLGSPAIDAGADLSSEVLGPAKDIEGTIRPQQSGFDIGAYEFADGTKVQLAAPKNLRVVYY